MTAQHWNNGLRECYCWSALFAPWGCFIIVSYLAAIQMQCEEVIIRRLIRSCRTWGWGSYMRRNTSESCVLLMDHLFTHGWYLLLLLLRTKYVKILVELLDSDLSGSIIIKTNLLDTSWTRTPNFTSTLTFKTCALPLINYASTNHSFSQRRKSTSTARGWAWPRRWSGSRRRSCCLWHCWWVHILSVKHYRS